MTQPLKKDRTWLYVGLTFMAFWAAYLLFLNPRAGFDGLAAPQLTGSGRPLPADYSWKVEDLNGKPVALGDYRGRPIVLNLWATWCGPCRQEMPSLVSLAAMPSLKGVAFLCVTNEKPSATVKSYAQANMQGLTVLYGNGLPEVFATDGIPATFVIAPDGSVASSEIGAARWDDPTVVEFLEALLKKAAPPPS